MNLTRDSIMEQLHTGQIKCECGGTMLPVWYKEYEYTPNHIKTGRFKRACSHLVCEECGETEIVDDSFDEPTWTDAKYDRKERFYA